MIVVPPRVAFTSATGHPPVTTVTPSAEATGLHYGPVRKAERQRLISQMFSGHEGGYEYAHNKFVYTLVVVGSGHTTEGQLESPRRRKGVEQHGANLALDAPPFGPASS
jgi:hypothetical protein